MIMLYSELSENGLRDSFDANIVPNEEAQVVDFSDSEILARICRYYSANQVLTRREVEIMVLILQGFGRKEISKRLFITENTVKTHTTKVYRKLGVSNKEELQNFIAKDAQSYIG